MTLKQTVMNATPALPEQIEKVAIKIQKMSHSPSIFLTAWGFLHLKPSRYAGTPVRIMLLPIRHSNGAAQKDTAIMKTQPTTKITGITSGNCRKKIQ